MKKIIFLLGIIVSMMLVSCSKEDTDDYVPPITRGEDGLTISTNGMTFSPASLNAKVGDQITFVVASGHTATRVDESTWQSNGSTSNGGFDFAEGTYTYTLQASDVGTIYYVCQFHVSMGMKGEIVVSEP